MLKRGCDTAAYGSRGASEARPSHGPKARDDACDCGDLAPTVRESTRTSGPHPGEVEEGTLTEASDETPTVQLDCTFLEWPSATSKTRAIISELVKIADRWTSMMEATLDEQHLISDRAERFFQMFEDRAEVEEAKGPRR